MTLDGVFYTESCYSSLTQAGIQTENKIHLLLLLFVVALFNFIEGLEGGGGGAKSSV